MKARPWIDTAGVDDAIRRVLAAEAAAEASMRDAARSAEAIIDTARTDARAIGTRAERRIRAMRSVFEAHTAGAVARLDATDRDAPAGRDAATVDARLVARAAGAVAAGLTGGRR